MSRWSGAAAGCCLVATLAVAADTPPSPIRQVQPEYSDELKKSSLVSFVKFDLGIDTDGKPFAIASETGLPDNVVQTIQQWRFRPAEKGGRAVPSAVRFALTLKRPIDKSLEDSLKQPWHPSSVELREALADGAAMSASAAVGLEAAVLSGAGGEMKRAVLLAYFTRESGLEPAAVHKGRASNIAWFVENQPDAEILSSPLSVINSLSDPLRDPAGYDLVRQLWNRQLSNGTGTFAVAAGAANFFAANDPVLAVQVLLPWYLKEDQASVLLGRVYALAALGVRGVDPLTGATASAESNQQSLTAFTAKARSVLASTEDARLLLSAMSAVSEAGRALAARDRLPPDYDTVCGSLFKRVQAIYPATSASCGTKAPSSVVDPDRNSGRGKIIAAHRTKQGPPMYPAEAKARRIQGTVRFAAVIGKDGKISSLELLKGPLALYGSARDAVSKWEYTPCKLDGEPVEVMTPIEVNYQLSQ
jgi:TonB family protein